MLLAFLVCSIALAHAEPDTTSSTYPELAPVPPVYTDGTRASEDGVPAVEGDGWTVEDNARTLDDDGHAIDDEAPQTDTRRSDDSTIDVDVREAALRGRRGWFGHIDVSLTWRRTLHEATAIQRDEVWLVGTWRL